MGFDHFLPQISFILLYFSRSGVELSVYTYIIAVTTYKKSCVMRKIAKIEGPSNSRDGKDTWILLQVAHESFPVKRRCQR